MSAAADAPARGASWKWWITGILLLATTINYMDRVTLSNASVRVVNELGLTNEQYGRFELFFGWAFGVGSLTFGFLADRWRVYFLYPAVLLGWSLMGIVSGFTHDYTSLIICRTLLGFFEAGHWPCALKTTFALLNEKDRTMGNSVLQSGASVGAIITPQIMRMLVTAEAGSWRFAFVAVGMTGLLWLVLWFACLRPRDLDVKTEASSGPKLNVSTILSSRRFWALALLIAAMQPAWHIPRVWLMQFLHNGRGFAESTVLNFTSVYYIATDIGCMLAGAFSMWLVRRWSMSPHDAKRSVYAGACVLTSCAVFIPFLGQSWLLLATLLLIGAGALAMFPCYYGFTQEISPQHVGRVTGLLGFWVWVATSPMHTVFGLLYDRTKSYDLGLVVACLVPWLGLLAMKFLWRKDDASAALLSPTAVPPCPEQSPS